MKKGFTLMELLVVVLIIGILAAVALPQYQRAVGKAKAAEAKAGLSAYIKALQVAHLETGKQAPSDSELSIDLPVSQYWDFMQEESLMSNGFWGCAVSAIGKHQMQGTNIRLVDEGYSKADHNHTLFGFACTDDGNNKCRNLGFTLYNEDEDIYIEP